MYCETCGRKTNDVICVDCVAPVDTSMSYRRIGSDVYDMDGYASEHAQYRKASEKQLEFIINMMHAMNFSSDIIKRKTSNLKRDKASHLINKLQDLNVEGVATDKQIAYIRQLLTRAGRDESDYRWDIDLLGKKQAANIIGELQSLLAATSAQLSYVNYLIQELGYTLEQIEDMGYEFEEDGGKISNMSFIKVSELIEILKQELG